jgi:hypothetical protein
MSAKIMIYDSEGRVVINASALPDPREVSYDLLLSYVPVSSWPKGAGLNSYPSDVYLDISIFMVRVSHHSPQMIVLRYL